MYFSVYTIVVKKGKTNKMRNNQQIIDPVIGSYIFNFVTKAIRQELPKNLQNLAINRETQIEWNLDMGPMALAFFLTDLEKKTFLDLDSNMNELYTVGDICSLIAERLKISNKATLLQKVSKLSLQHYFVKTLAIPQK